MKGFRVINVSIDWDYRVMSDYVEDFKRQYVKKDLGDHFIFGFSYGAVIALIAANELKPKKIYLCSLSAAFQEDMRAMKPWVRKLIGSRRIADAKKRSGRKLAKELAIPSVVFYGEAEGKSHPLLKIRCEETAKYAKDSTLVVVKGAPHKIDDPEYMKAIKEEFGRKKFKKRHGA